MPDDLEDDWAALGRPTKTQRAVRKVKEQGANFVFEFFNFLFGWVGKAWDAIWEVVFSDSLARLVIGLAVLAAAGYVGLQIAKTDGRIDYCMIILEKDEYVLEGHRPWRENETLMKKETREPLLKAAQEMSCPLR